MSKATGNHKGLSLFGLLHLVVRRDLMLAMRRRADVLTTLIFFVMVVSLFPLGVGPEPDMLRKMAAGVVWVAALLSSMLSLNRMFMADYLDGTLEQMLLAPQSLSMLVLGKILAHWKLSGLPLALMSPVLGLQFDMSVEALWVLIASLLLVSLGASLGRVVHSPQPGRVVKAGSHLPGGARPCAPASSHDSLRFKSDHPPGFAGPVSAH